MSTSQAHSFIDSVSVRDNVLGHRYWYAAAEAGLPILHSPFSILHSPIFNIQYSIFNIQYSIFSFQFSVFSFQFSIFNLADRQRRGTGSVNENWKLEI
jgi:hypothetical protein